jgi:hypothetical protein
VQYKRKEENKGPSNRPKKKKQWRGESFSATGAESCFHVARNSFLYSVTVIKPKHAFKIIV